MINAMKELALLELNRRFGSTDAPLDQLRHEHGQDIAPLLVEASEKVNRVYLLQPVPGQPGTVRMWSEELDDAKRRRLPFNKPSGAQSAAIGPVVKRTSKPKERPPFGPSPKIQRTTQEAFENLARNPSEWSSYFQEAGQIFFQNAILIHQEQAYRTGNGEGDPHPLAAAIRLILDKETVFVSVADAQDRWPGDRPEYHAYLAHALADIKYTTGDAPAHERGDCPLCGAQSVTLYPNALRGAGINLTNMDRAGAFPDLDTSQAWKGYGLCLDCADLLYIFKNHMLGRFLGRVAGEIALLLPALLGNQEGRRRFIKDWHVYVQGLQGKKGKAREDKTKSHEEDLMEFFAKQDDAHVVINILWATFGQVIDAMCGHVTDILPSRLQALDRLNAAANAWSHPLKPQFAIDEARFNLALSMLYPLFKRPGGRKASKANDSRRLFELKRQLAEAIYHATPLGRAAPGLWNEIMTTACWYLDEAVETGQSYGLLHEGYSEKTKRSFWTLAGWIRHLARFLYYLDMTRVLPMEHDDVYVPEMEKLKPYFQPGCGISSREKAFAFLLGILYGKLLQVQAARGVNVAANALTWLKRLKLSGRDLPGLYNKIREKLLAYGTEGNPEVRELILDIGRLGASLGDSIRLDTTSTCYFLLLGQSIAVEVLPKKSAKEEDES